MIKRYPSNSGGRLRLAPRRIALLASVAGIGVAMLVGVPGYGPSAISAWAANNQPIEAPASQTQAPAAGFADLVAKVKPAVVSVRVRSDNPAQVSSNEESRNWQRFGRGFGNFFGFNDQFGNSSGDQFGDRFGRNAPNFPNLPNGMRRMAAEGSGFFISADGYAVTNNHWLIMPRPSR